jgi:hypothetical protein
MSQTPSDLDEFFGCKKQNDIKYNKKNSKHMTDTEHEYGQTEQTTDILKIVSKGNVMDAWEQLDMCRFSRGEITRNKQGSNQNGVFLLLKLA